MARSPLTIRQVLAWADDHHRRLGAWPNVCSGPIRATAGEQWRTIDQCLRRGQRLLPGQSSLAELLAEHRGVRNVNHPPPLRKAQVLAWADAHCRRTGFWPKDSTGDIPEAPGETWYAIDNALRRGSRGLPGRSSLARFLARHRGVRNVKALPRLTLADILSWADAFYRREGKWPTVRSGGILETPGETWSGVDTALTKGLRGLHGGDSLARMLRRHRRGSNGNGRAT